MRSGIEAMVWWVVASPEPEHPDGLLLAVLRALGADDDDRAAGVGDEAAVEQVEGVGDPAGGEDVVDGDRVAHHRFGVERRPLARGDGDLGELLVGRAVLVHVAHAGHRVVRRRPADVVGHLELGGRVPGVECRVGRSRRAVRRRRRSRRG